MQDNPAITDGMAQRLPGAPRPRARGFGANWSRLLTRRCRPGAAVPRASMTIGPRFASFAATATVHATARRIAHLSCWSGCDRRVPARHRCPAWPGCRRVVAESKLPMYQASRSFDPLRHVVRDSHERRARRTAGARGSEDPHEVSKAPRAARSSRHHVCVENAPAARIPRRRPLRRRPRGRVAQEKRPGRTGTTIAVQRAPSRQRSSGSVRGRGWRVFRQIHSQQHRCGSLSFTEPLLPRLTPGPQMRLRDAAPAQRWDPLIPSGRDDHPPCGSHADFEPPTAWRPSLSLPSAARRRPGPPP